MELLLLIPLAAMAWEDARSRTINVCWPVLVLLLGVWLFPPDPYHTAANLFYCGMQYGALTLFFSFREKRTVRIADRYMGWGDIILLIVLCPVFRFPNFILFLTVSCIGVLLWYRVKDRKPDTIPFAGALSLFLATGVVMKTAGIADIFQSETWFDAGSSVPSFLKYLCMTPVPAHLPAGIIQQITAEQARHYGVLPFRMEEEEIWFFTSKSRDHPERSRELEVLLGRRVHLVVADEQELERAIARYYRPAGHSGPALSLHPEQDFPGQLLAEAGQLGCSDIHLEPYEKKARVRFRIDGVLVEKYELPAETYPALVNRLKVRANLDIAEKRLPQDGRIRFESSPGSSLDVRVSVLPVLHGEKIVLRLLGKDASHIRLEETGLEGPDLERYLSGVRRQTGMVLLSGPTGSGKTTTLYATLQRLNRPGRNILTIEDPVEYTLEGVNQVPVKENIGFGFAGALRTFLRQDPDIIMVGEIRDAETARMAVRASLTGHLVLSTVHANSAWGIVTRLADMDVPGYLLADTLNTVVAQRLIRLLCPGCKRKEPFPSGLLPAGYKLPRQPDFHFVATGCAECFYTGYAGRRAIFEVIDIDNTCRQHIRELTPEPEGLLLEKGIASLSDRAFSLFENGLTSGAAIYPVLADSV